MAKKGADILSHVLIVDDDPILTAIADSHFRKRGASEVATAGDGQQALDRFYQSPTAPTFILCDLNMPTMDGIEFLRSLEKAHYTGAIAIISGEAESVVALAERIGRTHDLNIVGTMQKPLKAGELDKLIEKAAEKNVDANPASSNVVTVKDLRYALANDQITAFYQPKIDMRSGRTAGVEALARWLHPEWGVVPPGNFIALAEQHGLIDCLTGIVLRSAVVDMWRWARKGIQLSCAINLSPHTLNNVNIPDEIAACVEATGLDPSLFVFEVTESSVVKKEATPMEVLARLRLKGFGLSIDDFGTGNSNFEQLRDFPFSELKIDRSFVANMMSEPFARQCAVTSVSLAKKLGLKVVAEGVENEDVRDAIVELGVDQLQGYLFGKPMPAEDFLRWLKGYRADTETGGAKDPDRLLLRKSAG